MTNQIAIEQGRPPWLPAADAEPALTLHTYDMPLIGVIRQHGQLYLFRCIDGHVDKANLWSYTALSPDEFAELEQVTADSLDDTVDSAAADRPAVLALADDERGITLDSHRPPGGLLDADACGERQPRGGRGAGQRTARPIGRLTAGLTTKLTTKLSGSEWISTDVDGPAPL